MKLSEAWLREWVDPPVDTETLADQLTMAGLEVAGLTPVAGDLDGVVVGAVLEVERHPNADRLTVCRVDRGGGEIVQVVCGAPNVTAGMRAPLAVPGARLPGGLKIRKSKIRQVESQGMLCSARELELGDDASGILALGDDAAVGADIREALALDDTVIEVDLTPNRGDCFSVAGIAREVGAIHRMPVKPPQIDPVPATIDDELAIRVEDWDGSPSFTGRIIRNVRPDAVTPVWMKERLRRSGVRPIQLVVDVTNYVMLELGQPMHAYDLRRLHGWIGARMAHDGDTLTLLDGRQIDVFPDTLVIIDEHGVLGLAGIMGGEGTGVAEDTTDIFLESAFFRPTVIGGRGRRYGLSTEASIRFERGVDPYLQTLAVERATALITAIGGGEPGPTTTERSADHMPSTPEIELRRDRTALVLGKRLDDEEIESILTNLQMSIAPTAQGWQVSPPSYRFDIEIEDDLIEEVGRIHGYNRIPETDAEIAQIFTPRTEYRVPINRVRDILVDRGYQEVMTYSFIEPGLQKQLNPSVESMAPLLTLSNPISADMSILRASMWPGLLRVLRDNLSRQQSRVRIFEYGVNFYTQHNEIKEKSCVAAVAAGERYPEQWDLEKQPVDFYDLKGDLEAVLGTTSEPEAFSFEADSHPVLHPGQCARIRKHGQSVGWLGMLHPRLVNELELTSTPIVFEFDTEPVLAAELPEYQEISKYPAIRRDIAVVVDETVTSREIEEVVREEAPRLLTELRVFDIYRGEGIDSGRKSIALGLILQETSRTLTDEEADAVVARVVDQLRTRLGANPRE